MAVIELDPEARAKAVETAKAATIWAARQPGIAPANLTDYITETVTDACIRAYLEAAGLA